MALFRIAVDDVDLMEALVNTGPSDDMEGLEARYRQLAPRDVDDSPHASGRAVLSSSH